MTEAAEAVLDLPFPRDDVLAISPRYRELRERAPVLPVRTPTGDPAWIVIAYEEAKQAFSDRRFGYFTHHDPQNASRMSEAALHAHPMGGLDFEEHTVRLRKLLAPGFTPRRLKLLEGWVQELTDRCLDDMAAARERDPGAPVDFHAMLGFRLPVMVIGALLGFPAEDADHVVGLSDRMGSTVDGADAFAAAAELRRYMARLIERKRADPGDDVFTDLIRAEAEDPSLFSARPIEAVAAGIVFPGHETTVVRMDFGLLFLLADPFRRDWLLADLDGRIDRVVEEVLRVTSAHNFGLMRYANEDIEFGGVTIARGDLVIISDAAANRDPALFDRPETFDPTRRTAGHLAFGHGAHTCLGKSLARMELRIAFASLFRRFPGIRLAIDPAELVIDDRRVGGGVAHVPVTW